MQHDAFFDYADDDLAARVPNYLRPKKGKRYFSPYRRRDKSRGIFALSIDLVADREHVQAIRDAMAPVPPMEWKGVEMRNVRAGPTPWIYGGHELFSTNFNAANGSRVHDYEILFPLGDFYVHIGASGRGDIAEFDETCRGIASSIRLKRLPDAVLRQRERKPATRAAPDRDVPTKHSRRKGDSPITYLTAEARVRNKTVHSALILPDEGTGGVRLFLLPKFEHASIPGPSSWHETEEDAKAEALHSLKIRDSDWTRHQGEPEWARTFRAARDAAIDAYEDAEGSDPKVG